MPVWNIYHPVDAYSDHDKKSFAKAITAMYSHIPKFYVNVLFCEIRSESFFVGGVAMDNFVRIVVTHIARHLTPEKRAHRVESINQVILPFVGGRGFDWEFHIDETPFDLWSIQGFPPPPPNSEEEKMWARENRPSEWRNATGDV